MICNWNLFLWPPWQGHILFLRWWWVPWHLCALHLVLMVQFFRRTLCKETKQWSQREKWSWCLSCTPHLQPCFPSKDSGHTQKPVDCGAPHAMVLHDFPAGKDIHYKLMEPWDVLSKPFILTACARRLLACRHHLISIDSVFRTGPCTQSCQKA